MDSLLFSNIDFYKNHDFIKLMREWNNMLDSDVSAPIYAEWRDVLLCDFYKASLEWWNKNKDDDFWREGLE